MQGSLPVLVPGRAFGAGVALPEPVLVPVLDIAKTRVEKARCGCWRHGAGIGELDSLSQNGDGQKKVILFV